jgi:hypothetical protein
MKDEKYGFFKNHADTLAIIGVNLAIAALLLSIILSNMSAIASTNASVASANARIDTLHVMFYDLLKESKNK